VAEWSTLTGVDTSGFEELASSVDDASSTIAGFLQAVAAVLRVVAMFLRGDADIITSLVNAAIDTVESMIEDVLSNNVALAFHVNLTWDHNWVVSPTMLPVDRRSGRPNWTEDRDIPWSGNGIDGWLLDIAASSQDEANPFRPLTDSDTTVAGFIYVIGVPSFDNVGDIFNLLGAIGDFSDVGDIFDEARLEREAKDQAILRAKEALFAEAQDAWRNEPTAIKDELEEALGQTFTDWTFSEGTFPKWISVPMARIFPPIHDLLEKLRKLMDALRMPTSNPLEELAELLAYKAELLANLALEVGDLIQQILALAVLLEGGNFIWIQVGPIELGEEEADSATGGMSSFISTAINADEKPDLGDGAIFGGLVGVVTVDNPIDHLQSFFEMIGVSVEEYTENSTSRTEQLEDTLEEVSGYF